MPKLTKYGYIILGDGYQAEQHRVTISSAHFSSSIICGKTIRDAILIAKQMVLDGIEVIELCGEFGQSGAFQIVNAINCKVPVGYVSFVSYEHDKLTDFLSRD
ncbi:MAG: hypothetical protein COB24_05210 [Hyphomicrobiales bacterium]|nr:MAG: hypothetical protein COB24_05210 [Hyphomicrobiales bacterium]